jgi:hypothetical protein
MVGYLFESQMIWRFKMLGEIVTQGVCSSLISLKDMVLARWLSQSALLQRISDNAFTRVVWSVRAVMMRSSFHNYFHRSNDCYAITIATFPDLLSKFGVNLHFCNLRTTQDQGEPVSLSCDYDFFKPSLLSNWMFAFSVCA